MYIEIDSELGIIIVDNVTISLEVLKTLCQPDPRKTYQIKRVGNDVTLTEYTDTYSTEGV